MNLEYGDVFEARNLPAGRTAGGVGAIRRDRKRGGRPSPELAADLCGPRPGLSRVVEVNRKQAAVADGVSAQLH